MATDTGSTIHTIKPRNGVKGRIEELLRARGLSPDKAIADIGLTNGEIVRALGLDKTANGDVSAALHKLRSEGKLTIDTGPRTYATGPRYVKRYRIKRKPAATAPIEQNADDRRFLSMCR